MPFETVTPLIHTLEDPRKTIWETAEKDWQMYLLLDSACDSDAAAKLFLFEQYGQHTPLFAGTSFGDAMDVTPWLTEISPSSELVEWLLGDDAPQGWGMLLFTQQNKNMILRHFRSLMKVTAENGKHLNFRPWDGRIVARIAAHFPEDIPRLLGPVQHAVLRPEGGEWAALDNPYPLDEEALEKYYSVTAWYMFDETRQAIFDDKKLKGIAINISESLYAENEADTAIPPDGKDVFTFCLDSVWQGYYSLGLRNEESLRHFTYSLFYRGTDFLDMRNIQEFQAGHESERTLSLWLHKLWTEAKSHG